MILTLKGLKELILRYFTYRNSKSITEFHCILKTQFISNSTMQLNRLWLQWCLWSLGLEDSRSRECRALLCLWDLSWLLLLLLWLRPSELPLCRLQCASELRPLSLSLFLSSLSSFLLDDLCSCLGFSFLGSLSRSSVPPRQVVLISGELGWGFRTSLDSDFWPLSEFLPLCFLEPGSSFSFIILLLGDEEEAGCSACTSWSVFSLSFFLFFFSFLSGGQEGQNKKRKMEKMEDMQKESILGSSVKQSQSLLPEKCLREAKLDVCHPWYVELLYKATPTLNYLFKDPTSWASLVVQWLRIRLPMQGTRVRALVWEDPTCRGATKPVSHNYWACASGACALQRERPRQW